MMPPWSDTEGLEASVRVSSISSKIEVAGVCCSLSMVAAVDTVKNGDQSLHTWPASLFSWFFFLSILVPSLLDGVSNMLSDLAFLSLAPPHANHPWKCPLGCS